MTKNVGKKRLHKGRANFRVTYHDGEIIAVAYNKTGQEIGRDALQTAGPETLLRLETEKPSCSPKEMVYLRIRYTDSQGETKPMEKHRVTIVAENGTVIGTANGSTYFQGNYAQSEVPTYFGEAQAVVQAGKEGTLRVTASDEKDSFTIEIPCR